MSKQKYYVVWKGRLSGVFNSWETCSAQVSGYTGAEFKSFESLSAAKSAYQKTYRDFVRQPAGRTGPPKDALIKPLDAQPSMEQAKMILAKPALPSICVDAACSGVPGPVEWRGVETQTSKELFRFGPYPAGTNNVGEFLAIFQGLLWLKERQLNWPVYSDSKNAILWVRLKKCRTKLIQTTRNAGLFELIATAETWLDENRYLNKILKWETRTWGENPADFGRK